MLVFGSQDSGQAQGPRYDTHNSEVVYEGFPANCDSYSEFDGLRCYKNALVRKIAQKR